MLKKIIMYCFIAIILFLFAYAIQHVYLYFSLFNGKYRVFSILSPSTQEEPNFIQRKFCELKKTGFEYKEVCTTNVLSQFSPPKKYACIDSSDQSEKYLRMVCNQINLKSGPLE